MKNFIKIFIIIIFNILNSFSQVKDKLFILIDEKPSFESINDSLAFQQYQIIFNEKNMNNQNKLIIDKDGNLSKKVSIIGNSKKTIKLTYNSLNNEPYLIKKNEVKNILKLKEITDFYQYENIVEIFDNYFIFVVNEIESLKNYYLIKKVKVEKVSGL